MTLTKQGLAYFQEWYNNRAEEVIDQALEELGLTRVDIETVDHLLGWDYIVTTKDGRKHGLIWTQEAIYIRDLPSGDEPQLSSGITGREPVFKRKVQ